MLEQAEKTDYSSIIQKYNHDPYKFCTLLQFNVYAQTLNYKSDSLGNTSYRLVQFRVQDFLKYTKLPSNYYQLKK
jgi:hypothetical protein